MSDVLIVLSIAKKNPQKLEKTKRFVARFLLKFFQPFVWLDVTISVTVNSANDTCLWQEKGSQGGGCAEGAPLIPAAEQGNLRSTLCFICTSVESHLEHFCFQKRWALNFTPPLLPCRMSEQRKKYKVGLFWVVIPTWAATWDRELGKLEHQWISFLFCTEHNRYCVLLNMEMFVDLKWSLPGSIGGLRWDRCYFFPPFPAAAIGSTAGLSLAVRAMGGVVLQFWLYPEWCAWKKWEKKMQVRKDEWFQIVSW